MKSLPVGISDFKRIREEDMFYVDKSMLISEYFRSSMFVTLYTRPRRFGKSLNLSMFHHFLEIGADPSLFDGLRVMEDEQVVKRHMGKYPVIHLSLKSVNQASFSLSRSKMCTCLGSEAMRFSFLLESPRLNEEQKEKYRLLIKTGKEGELYEMTDGVLTSGLAFLSELLHLHYGNRCVILLDEYDVPLDKAYVYNYYQKMLPLVKGLLNEALKDNPHVAYGIVTGCLRIAKESLFTDVNNFKVNSVTSRSMDEYFGFTRNDVITILRHYDLAGYEELFRERYDGYRFGVEDIYNPWDVVNAVADSVKSLSEGGTLSLEDYWKSAGENLNLHRLLNHSRNILLRSAVLKLADGGEVAFDVNEELTYTGIYDENGENRFANFFSLMLMTGFVTLTEDTCPDTVHVKVRIPNQEVRDIFEEKFMAWNLEKAKEDGEDLREFCRALELGDAGRMEELLGIRLRRMIHIHETMTRSRSENLYHGILLGFLSYRQDWHVESNIETGDGWADIVAVSDDNSLGVIIEVRYADSENLEKAARSGLDSIKEREYLSLLQEIRVEKILTYGISFRLKKCRVVQGEIIHNPAS